MRVLVARGRRVSLLLVRGRSPRLLVHEGSRVVAIRARNRSGLPVRLGLDLTERNGLDLTYYDIDFFGGPNEKTYYLINDENTAIE